MNNFLQFQVVGGVWENTLNKRKGLFWFPKQLENNKYSLDTTVDCTHHLIIIR